MARTLAPGPVRGQRPCVAERLCGRHGRTRAVQQTAQLDGGVVVEASSGARTGPVVSPTSAHAVLTAAE